MSSARLAYGCGVLVALLAVGVGQARAGMAVSPLKQEVSLRPGETGTVRITLSNHSRSVASTSESARLDVVDVRVTEDGSILFHEPGTMPQSASRWVSLARTSATLDPNQSEQVECTIRVPPAAPPGEYYTAVMVTMQTKGRTDRGVVVQYRIASGIFVTVLGRTLTKQARISRCEWIWPDEAEAPATQPATSAGAASPPAAAPEAEPPLPKVSVLLDNTGPARFDASGRVRLFDARRRMVFAAPLTTKRPCVFGGDSRLFEAAIGKPLPAGRYVIKVEMDYESTWSKARYELPVEITAEQAEMLAMRSRQHRDGSPSIEVEPERVAVSLRPGAMRSLGLTLRNTADGPVRGLAKVAPSEGQLADAWISAGPQEFTIMRSGRRSIQLKVQVPEGTPADSYASTVLIQAGPDGSGLQELRIPVQVDVQAEK